MKITAGLGSIDEYITYVKAGADELFCGYMPAKWVEKFGINMPVNRREVLYYNVQLGSKSELVILQQMIEKYKVPVSITFNSIYYTSEQYPVLVEIIKECMKIGFDSFIIADIGLLLHLQEAGIMSEKCKIHISGEMSEVNSLMVGIVKDLGAARIIFQRRNSSKEMAKIIDKEPELEYEAFMLNELCHFHGAFCSTFHCDELCHMCLLPYELEEIHGKKFQEQSEQNNKTDLNEKNKISPKNSYILERDYHDTDQGAIEQFIPGETGCNLCNLWDFREAGVTWLKVVGRGNYVDDMKENISALKKAINIIKDSADKEEYLTKMRRELFPAGCSRKCMVMEENVKNDFG